MSRRYTLLATLALALFGCAREKQAEESALKTFDCFTVSIEETEMTKAHMEDGGVVKWDAWDRIGVFSDKEGPKPFVRGEDGLFRGEAVTGTKFYAYYPYEEVNCPIEYDSNNPTTLRLDSYLFGLCDDRLFYFPMIATSSSNKLSFRQLFGLLHFDIESEYEITSIQLISNSNELFNGRGSISLLDESPIYVLDAGNGASIEDSSWDKNGAYSSMWASLINYGKTTDAYFPIPPMTFKQGFTVQVFFREPVTGYGSFIEKKTIKTVEITRGVMKSYSMKIEAPAEISVSPMICVFPADGGQEAIKVTSNGEWSVSELPGWCTLSSTTGFGDAELVLRVPVNEGRQRNGRLVINCRERTTYLDVTQLPAKGWQNQNFVHKSLYMMFTSVYCSYSSTMNQKIHAADYLIGDKYHRVDVYTDELGDNEINFPYWDDLVLFYSGIPSGTIDLRNRLINSGDAEHIKERLVSSILQQDELYPPATGIEFDSSISNHILTVQGKVYSHFAEDYKICVYVLEDNIYDCYDDVLRLSLTAPLGDSFTVDSENTISDFSFNASVPNELNIDKLSVLVFIQRQYGSQVIVRDANYGDYYIDNCRKAKVGEKAELLVYDYSSGSGNEEIGIDDDITF